MGLARLCFQAAWGVKVMEALLLISMRFVLRVTLLALKQLHFAHRAISI
jgi:hypothetical protein